MDQTLNRTTNGNDPVPFPFRFRSVSVPFPFRFRSVSVPFPFRFRSVSVPFPFRFRSVSVPFPFPFRFRSRSTYSSSNYVSFPFRYRSLPVPFPIRSRSVPFSVPLRSDCIDPSSAGRVMRGVSGRVRAVSPDRRRYRPHGFRPPRILSSQAGIPAARQTARHPRIVPQRVSTARSKSNFIV